jgi:hypothetical protein
MRDEKIFAQFIIDRVKSNSKKIEIKLKSDFNQSKIYDSYKIPDKNLIEENGFNFAVPKKQEKQSTSPDNDIFAEIEINGNNNLHQTDSISKSVKIDLTQEKKDSSQNSERDEKRELFLAMREIARDNNSAYFLNTKFYNKQVQHENSKIFYKQAQFMKDFEDNYNKVVPFSSYFPYYQSMNYEQLRTYFTWRTKLRKGVVENTSLSYAFIYIYELINNIGVENPVDGLNKLFFFWKSVIKFDMGIDKYVIKWLKDYYIYYEMPNSFKDFLLQNNLQDNYLNIVFYEPEKKCDLVQLSAMSKYNIKKSNFYNDEKKLVKDCSEFVIDRLKSLFSKSDLGFESMIFQTAKSKLDWVPFEGALFYQHVKQTNRQIVLSNVEVYTFNQNKCLRSVLITRDSGKYLLAYIFKQMEAVLRKVTNYKFKITANVNIINTETLLKLGALGISIEKVVTDATLEFYADRNKTIVSVDKSALEKIRAEALQTQEKLSIPEGSLEQATIFTNENNKTNKANKAIEAIETNETNKIEDNRVEQNLLTQNDKWLSFKNLLSELELKALAIILQDDRDIKKFADENRLMIEVLVDSINEKAFDSIGDNVLEIDYSINIYDEYRDKIMHIICDTKERG